MHKKIRVDFWTVVTWGIAGLFAIFLVYPLFSLFLSGFQAPGSNDWSLINYIKFFSKPYYVNAIFNSFKVTLSVTLIATFLGMPLSYFMTTFKIKGKGLLQVLIIISMMSPNFIGAYSWILLLGRSGRITKWVSQWLGWQLPSIYGFGGMLLVFSLKLYPFIYMYVSGALKKIDVSLIEASESLGCRGIKKVVTIIMPLILPTLLSGGLLVFMNSLADFGTPMLIGEGYVTMPVLVYSEFVSEVGGEANFAAAMATIMVVITAILFSLQKWFVNKKSFTMSSLRPIAPKKLNGMKNILVHLYIYILVFLSIIPQVTVIYTSFLNTNRAVFKEGYSLVSYRTILDSLADVIKNSYLFSLIAIIIIVLLGMFIAYISVRRRSWLTSMIDTVAMFPYIIPGSVLGITLLLAFNKKPLILSGTATIIIVSLVIRRMAYTLRSSSAILYQISPSVEEASISLGDTPIKSFFKVTGIMMLPGVLSGAILSWITLINELSSSVILFTGHTRTMSVAIYNEVIRASYGTAAALATILTATTVVSLLFFFKVTGRKDVSI